MFPDTELSSLYRLIRRGKIKLNGKKVPPSARVREGDRIDVFFKPEISDTAPDDRGRYADRCYPVGSYDGGRQEPVEQGTALKTLIIHENRHVLVLNKPAGIVVHGPGSIDRMVSSYLKTKNPPSLSFRPGPVHRLDQNTSGILLFSKSLEGARTLSRLLRERKIKKNYVALLDGQLLLPVLWKDFLNRDSRTRVSRPDEVAGKLALTRVTPVAPEKHITLVLCQIETGRTHQIRSQAALHHHPLTGDAKYGGSRLIPAFLLHAASVLVEESAPLLGFSALMAPLPVRAKTLIETLLGGGTLSKLDTLLREASF